MKNIICSQNVAALIVITLFVSLEVNASHLRYGHLFWQQTGPNTVDVTFQNAWRRDGYGCIDPATLNSTLCSSADGYPGVGDVFNEFIGATSFSWGDGTSTGTLLYVVTSIDIDNNWLFAVALDTDSLPLVDTTLSHTYASPGDYSVVVSSCCRIHRFGGVNEHMNNPSGDYRFETIVNVGSENNSPVSVMPPIVSCPVNGLCEFTVPASDPETDELSFRLSSSSEAGAVFRQPVGAAIDAVTGVYSWDTTGVDLASNPNNNTLYSTQVMIEDGNTKVPLDFFIQLVDVNDPTPPQLFPPAGSPPICETTQVVRTDEALSFEIITSDPDLNDVVSLNVVGLPRGAIMQPQLPVVGNPISSIFNWSPSETDLGNHVLNFTASSSAGGTADCPVSIRVTDPCDVDADEDVDIDDIDDIFDARNSTASGPRDPRDADGDGVITVLDGRVCVLRCTLEQCASANNVQFSPLFE